MIFGLPLHLHRAPIVIKREVSVQKRSVRSTLTSVIGNIGNSRMRSFVVGHPKPLWLHRIERCEFDLKHYVLNDYLGNCLMAVG